MFLPGDRAEPDRNAFDWLSALRFLERPGDWRRRPFDAAKNINRYESFRLISLC